MSWRPPRRYPGPAAHRPGGSGGWPWLSTRGLDGMTPARAVPRPAGPLAGAGGLRPACHPDRRHVVLERAVVLRRLPPAPAVTWPQAHSLGAAGVDASGQDSGFTIPSRWAMVAAS